MENCTCFKKHKKIISYIIFMMIVNILMLTTNLKISYDIKTEIFEPNSTIYQLIELLTKTLDHE